MDTSDRAWAVKPCEGGRRGCELFDGRKKCVSLSFFPFSVVAEYGRVVSFLTDTDFKGLLLGERGGGGGLGSC